MVLTQEREVAEVRESLRGPLDLLLAFVRPVYDVVSVLEGPAHQFLLGLLEFSGQSVSVRPYLGDTGSSLDDVC